MDLRPHRLPPFAAAIALALAGCASKPPPAPDAPPPKPEISGESFLVNVDDGPRALTDEQLRAWGERATSAFKAYFGRGPAARVAIRVRLVPGDRIGVATTLPEQSSIEVPMGERVASLDRDWVLVHEMIHLTLPPLDPAYHWFEEGVATYVEPIARAKAGLLAPEEVWREFRARMPEGQPTPTDGGLDGATANRRVYWGGAAFCLEADVAIRRATRNKSGLEHALRAIFEARGSAAGVMPFERVLETGDRATGTKVLADLYAQAGPAPLVSDLATLWKKLGTDGAALRDDASLAVIRHSICGRGAAPSPRLTEEDEARISANELIAIATLRNLVAAQAQFQASAMADGDKDGMGEHGFFAELSGGKGVRGGNRMSPAVLPERFREVTKGWVEASGYRFRIFLPGPGGSAVPESDRGGAPEVGLDADFAEEFWCCYAWPATQGKTGLRTFFVNQQRNLLAAEVEAYSGDAGPKANAAFRGKGGALVSPIAKDVAGNDGNKWAAVE